VNRPSRIRPLVAAAPAQWWPGTCAILLALLAAAAPAQDKRSSFEDMSSDIQKMQEDDFLNPGMLWVSEGAELWSKPPGSAPSCADCHGAPESMAGVSAQYPAWDGGLDEAVDLERRINLCRARHQSAEPLARESRPLLALTALVAHQSRGHRIEPSDDPRMDIIRARGQELFITPVGQLDLACTECHDANAGRRLAAATIPQGHPNGYPLYRLEWETLGSLERRFRNCLVGVRAEPYDPGSRNYTALKAYLMERAAGMEIETPAVRP
jgi:sulfur-oxidizing protein SoxA